MSRYRDFDAARAEHAAEPLTFRLAGRDFTTLPVIPAAVLLDLAAHSGQEVNGEAFHLFGECIRSLVVPEQRDAMNEALHEIGVDEMFAVVHWVMEELTGRPLDSAASSPDSPSKPGEPLSLAWRQRDEEARSA